MLVLVQGLNRNKLRKAVMCALLCNHRARDDSDDLTVSGQRGGVASIQYTIVLVVSR
jgi:hypothetical protein